MTERNGIWIPLPSNARCRVRIGVRPKENTHFALKTRLAQGRTGLTITLVAVTYAAQPPPLRELFDEYR